MRRCKSHKGAQSCIARGENSERLAALSAFVNVVLTPANPVVVTACRQIDARSPADEFESCSLDVVKSEGVGIVDTHCQPFRAQQLQRRREDKGKQLLSLARLSPLS
jgi:hypothetical protein